MPHSVYNTIAVFEPTNTNGQFTPTRLNCRRLSETVESRQRRRCKSAISAARSVVIVSVTLWPFLIKSNRLTMTFIRSWTDLIQMRQN